MDVGEDFSPLMDIRACNDKLLSLKRAFFKEIAVLTKPSLFQINLMAEFFHSSMIVLG